jgi:predicted small secreted protein
MKRPIAVAALALLAAPVLASCATDADVAAENLSYAAEQFEVNRRIVFINGITDEYLLEITGLCSVETGDSALKGSLEVTCKTGPGTYKKHFLGLSDNVTFLVEQIESVGASTSQYRVVFRPSVIIPDVEIDR